MEEEYQCSECGKVFSSEELLEKHSEMEHGHPAIYEVKEFELPEIHFNRSQLTGFLLGFLLAFGLIGGYTVIDNMESTVGITVVTCDNCSYSKFRQTTDQLMKTEYREVDYQSEEGQKLIQKYNLNYVPGFIFDKKLENAENFTEIKSVVVEFDDAYVLPDKGVEAAQRQSEGMSLE